jgi:hypothetical protein
MIDAARGRPRATPRRSSSCGASRKARAALIGEVDGAARIETLRKLDRCKGLAYAKKQKAFHLLQGMARP